ncbi:MAG TPA: hypothetical protein VKR06_46660 [Ktedonosporobacter sp.]|nr:hypothetical protein [Ktedonosporobacter sp.]
MCPSVAGDISSVSSRRGSRVGSHLSGDGSYWSVVRFCRVLLVVPAKLAGWRTEWGVDRGGSGWWLPLL